MTWYRLLLERAAAAHHLDPDLVQAVVLTESSGLTSAYRYEQGFWDRYLKGKPPWKTQEPRRVSASYGLMQVMWPVAVELGCTEPDPEYLFVPSIGLKWGCRKLKTELEWAGGDVEKALIAYNGGRGSAASKPYPNQAYADKVLARLATLKVP